MRILDTINNGLFRFDRVERSEKTLIVFERKKGMKQRREYSLAFLSIRHK